MKESKKQAAAQCGHGTQTGTSGTYYVPFCPQTQSQFISPSAQSLSHSFHTIQVARISTTFLPHCIQILWFTYPHPRPHPLPHPHDVASALVLGRACAKSDGISVDAGAAAAVLATKQTDSPETTPSPRSGRDLTLLWLSRALQVADPVTHFVWLCLAVLAGDGLDGGRWRIYYGTAVLRSCLPCMLCFWAKECGDGPSGMLLFAIYRAFADEKR